jgi:cell division initiation protein
VEERSDDTKSWRPTAMITRKTLSPIEIQSHEFKKRLRGYDPQEVHLFLQALAESYQSLVMENQRLNQQNAQIESQLDEFRRRENILKEALYTAQRMADEVKAQAVREAQSIVQEAHLRADALLQEARLQVHQVDRSIMDLKIEREHFLLSLKDLLARVEILVSAVEERKNSENVALLGGK